MGSNAFTGLLVFGILLLIGGATVLPFSDPTIGGVLAGLGIAMIIGGIIYVVALQAKAGSVRR
jgi:hypothetical protein